MDYGSSDFRLERFEGFGQTVRSGPYLLGCVSFFVHDAVKGILQDDAADKEVAIARKDLRRSLTQENRRKNLFYCDRGE